MSTRSPQFAVCGDEQGQYLGASTMVCQGISDPSLLEAMAYCVAMAFDVDLAHNQLIIRLTPRKSQGIFIQELAGNMETSFGKIIVWAKDLDACSFFHEVRLLNIELHSPAKYSLGLYVGCHVCPLHLPVLVLIYMCKYLQSIKSSVFSTQKEMENLSKKRN